MKLKWQVAPAPTGRYRSFEHRSWPSADYEGDKIAVAIYCEDDYAPWRVRENAHKELTVRIADWSDEHRFKWRTLKQRFNTLKEAKEAVTKFLSEHKEYWPTTNGK